MSQKPDIERVSNAALMQAVAAMFDAERAATDKAIAEMHSDRFVKSAAVALLKGNLRCLQQRFGHIGQKRSVIVRGHAPASLKGIWGARK